MPVKENGKQFKSLRREQISKLLTILGESEAVELYLRDMDEIINTFIILRKNPLQGARSPAETRDKISAIKHSAGTLIAELQHAAIETGKPYSDGTPIDSELWSIFQSAQSMKCMPQRVVADPDFLRKLVGSLRYLEEITTSALTLIASPKRGDISRNEREQQLFEKNMLWAYESAFGCYPAQTQSGAFQRSTEIFYCTLGFPVSNSYQRIRSAINKNQRSRFPSGIPESLKPKRGLHPNRI